MDGSEVKLSCSLRWLSGMLPQGHSKDREQVQQLLLDPYSEGCLKQDVVLRLTTPDLYTSVYSAILSSEQQREATFWPLIHSLARRGIYVTEEEGDAVNHAVLAQRDPFRKGSHLAMIDALMSLYVSSVISVPKIVKTVKQFSTFNASKDLPSGNDGCLKLWLNKVSQSVCERRKTETDALIQDPNTQQRRRNKLKLLNAMQHSIHPVEDISIDIGDGQCLAALLLHYVPDKVNWTDFHFSEQVLPSDQARSNLSKVRDVCSTLLPPPGFHITPGELLQWSQSTLLTSNIRAMLTHLYHSFESKRTSSTSTVSKQSISTASNSDVRVLQQRQSSLAVTKRTIPPSYLSKKRHTIHSYSTSDIFSEPPSSVKLREMTRHNQSGSNIHSGQDGLSSYSASALIENHTQERIFRNPAGFVSSHSTSNTTSSTVFKPPIRSSVTASQAAALASFNNKPPPLLKKGPQTRSSPAIRVSITEAPPLMSSKSQQQIITASTDNLLIREKMLTEKMNRAAASGALLRPQHYNGRLNNSAGNSSSDGSSSDGSSSSLGADVSGNCTTATQSWRNIPAASGVSNDHTDHGGIENTNNRSDAEHLELLSHAYPLNDNSSELANPVADEKDGTEAEVKEGTNTETKSTTLGVVLNQEGVECRSSFTLNKRHTYASASAAGLPIIENGGEKEEKEVTPPSPLLKEKLINTSDYNKSQDRSSSGSSSGSLPVVLHLRIYPDRKVSIESENTSNVPPAILELRRQLRSRMNEWYTRQAILEKQELIEKQKFMQKVYQAVMQKSNEGSSDKPTQDAPVPTASQSQVKAHEVKSPNPSRLDNKRASNVEERREPLPQARHKSPSLAQFELLEAQVIANEETLSSTAKKPTLAPKSSHLGAITLSPIAPFKMDETNKDEGATAEAGLNAEGGVGHNPWREQEQSQIKRPTLNPVSQEELRKKREHLVRTRLEEREKARRIAVEERRRETKERNLQQQPAAKTPAVPVSEGDKETIHFVLSNHLLPQASTPSSVTTSPARTSEASPSRQSDYLVHNGPESYVKPQARSNKKIIKNAICHVCLAGDVNMTIKQRALEELEASTANHVMVLFRDTIGFKFRALYWFSPDTNYVTKMFGSGPRVIKQHMVSHYYKYNSGLKEFKEIQSRSFSISLDAFTMKNEFWTNRKSNVLGKRTSTGTVAHK